MKTYKAICPTFGYKFAFNAVDQKDANHKMIRYNSYHSITGSDKIYAEETEEVNSNWMHNEYVN